MPNNNNNNNNSNNTPTMKVTFSLTIGQRSNWERLVSSVVSASTYSNHTASLPVEIVAVPSSSMSQEHNSTMLPAMKPTILKGPKKKKTATWEDRLQDVCWWIYFDKQSTHLSIHRSMVYRTKLHGGRAGPLPFCRLGRRMFVTLVSLDGGTLQSGGAIPACSQLIKVDACQCSKSWWDNDGIFCHRPVI